MDIVRAWKDPAYRAELERSGHRVPPHPAGPAELLPLTQDQTSEIAGASDTCIVASIFAPEICVVTYVVNC